MSPNNQFAGAEKNKIELPPEQSNTDTFNIAGVYESDWTNSLDAIWPCENKSGIKR